MLPSCCGVLLLCGMHRQVALPGMIDDLRAAAAGDAPAPDGGGRGGRGPAVQSTAAALALSRDPFSALSSGMGMMLPPPVPVVPTVSAADKAAAEERKKETTLVRAGGGGGGQGRSGVAGVVWGWLGAGVRGGASVVGDV
jgi:hypothetical protein